MKIVTQSGNIVNIDRFDMIKREENVIYACNKCLEKNIRVPLGKYGSEKEAEDVMQDLISQLNTFRM